MYLLHATMLGRSEQAERCQAVDAGRRRREERLHQPGSDSMETTSPQGRTQEGGPLTQAEGEGGGSAEQSKIWPCYESLGVC